MNDESKLNETAKKLRSEYQKQWRQKNKDKVRRYNKEGQRRYWMKRALEELKSQGIDVELLKAKAGVSAGDAGATDC